MMEIPESSVIGLGGLGAVFAKALVDQGLPVKSVFNRSGTVAYDLASSSDIAHSGVFPSSLDQLGKLVFLTVSDRAIEEVAQRISQLADSYKGYTFVHCSGNESSEVLQSLKEKGAMTASFHPLQSFTAKSDSSDFKGIFFSLQGDPKTFTLLKVVAQQLGSSTIELTRDQKTHLHAAAVMASNYLTTLLDSAVDIGSEKGLARNEVKKALLPLMRTTLKNAEKQSLPEALSGPIKRGDLVTVKKHLELLQGQSELRELYCILGLRSLKLAELSGKLDGTTADNLRKILHQQII